MPIYNFSEYIKIIRPVPDNWPKDIYGIPYIKKSNIDISNINNGKWLISLNNAPSNAKNKNCKIIHCFMYDKKLLSFFNNPIKMLTTASGYYACSTYDFSMDSKMEVTKIIEATYNNRWSGMWLQSNGIKNIAVTVGWVNSQTYDICFSGIYDGTLLIISTLGACLGEAKSEFLEGYYELRTRFPHSQIICVGNKIDGMDNDVCYVAYNQSFGNHDKYNDYYQMKLFNWNYKE